MTSQDRELAIADNIAYVDAVLEGLVREHGAPRAIVFAGFSQGVAMAYRAALAGRRRAAGVLAVGGDVPPELHGTPAERWSAVLAATGSRDEWFTPTRLEQDGQLLRARRPDARTLVFEGGHEWAPGLIEAGRGFLAGLEGAL